MNRSVLIVICDFLLVSLLAFSTVDINKIAEEGTVPQARVDIATNTVDTVKDLAAVMRLALDEERKERDQLLGELASTRGTLGEERKERDQLLGELAKTRGTLSEREKQAQAIQQELQSREQEARRMQEREANLQQELQSREQEARRMEERQASLQQELQSRDQEARRVQEQQSNLQQQFTAAQTNVQTLSQQLQSSSTDALLSKEKLAAMEAEMRKQAEQAAALQQQLAQLAKSNQVVLSERQRLAGQLQVAEVERRHATEQAARMQEQVKIEREEKAKLAEGVKALASTSGELTREIRENRPLAPNTIFNEFVTNRVKAEFSAFRSGLLGTTRRKETETVLATDGTNIFALCHVEDTPLTLWSPGTDWDGLTGTLGRDTRQVAIRSLSFHLQDPRVLWMQVSQTEADKLGGKVYRISADPYKFQDAVLVGAREGYYGECKFQIELNTPEYVKLDRNLLKGMFGKFNPTRGDFVFSKTGELLGIMANSTYCLMINNLDASATIQFGQDIRAQRTGETLSRLYAFVFQMPAKLQ